MNEQNVVNERDLVGGRNFAAGRESAHRRDGDRSDLENWRTTRRRFLAQLLAVAGAIRVSENAFADNGTPEKRVPVVDTHVHCFAGKNDSRFPYHPKGSYQPEKASTPEHLLSRMKDAGVDFAVVVHPEPYQDDHRYLEHCLDVGGAKLKGTCLFFADRSDSIDRMRELVKRRPGKIVAARIHAYVAERLPPFDRPELRTFWKAAADLGLAVPLHFEPRFGKAFEPLIREFSGTKVVIDHLGRPFQGSKDDHAAIVGWSKLPNTVMKISSLPEPTERPIAEVTAVVRTLTDAFGPDRLIYGGGYSETATGETYRAYRDRTAALLDHLNPTDRDKVLGATAAKLYSFM